MSRVCMVTGKGPQVGHKVSHSNRKAKKRWLPNLQSKRYWLPSEQRFVRLRVSTAGMRIIDKRGVEKVVKELRAKGVL